MKKIHALLLFALFMLSMQSQAQKTKLKEISGAPVEGRTRGLGWANGFVGGFNHNGDTYAVGVEQEIRTIYVLVMAIPIPFNPRVNLFRLDDKMNVAEKSVIDLMPNGQMVTYHSFQRVGDNFFIFFQYKNKGEKKHYFFCKRVSLIDKKEDIFKLAEFSKHGKGEKISFKIETSSDKKKFVVITNYSKKEAKKKTTPTKSKKTSGKVKNTTTFDYVVLDEEMKVSSYGVKVKLDAEDDETIWQYYIAPSGKLMVVTTAEVDFKGEDAEKKPAGKGKTKAKKTKTVKKFARRFYLHVYDNDNVARVPVDDDAYLRGFYAYPMNDSQVRIFTYFSETGQYTDGLRNAVFNLNTKELGEPEMATFADVKGAGEKSTVEDDDPDVENPKSKKKSKKGPKKKLDKHDNVMKKLLRITYVDKLKNGNFVVFGEIYYFWVEVVTSTTTNSRGAVSRQVNYYYHHDYGPAGVIKLDSSGMVESSTIVDYEANYVNYDPGYGGLPMGVGQGEYMVVTNAGYSVIDFSKTNNSIKNFTSINNGIGKRGANTLVRSDNAVLMILNKKKSVTFSTISGIDRGGEAKKKKKSKKG